MPANWIESRSAMAAAVVLALHLVCGVRFAAAEERAAGGAGEAPSLELWLYHATNLLVDENLGRLETLWRRAAKCGYTRVLLADSKFSKLGDMDARYFRNIDRAKKLATELGIRIVPALFSIGYSNDLLWHDPNLAEGLPVVKAPFVVKGRIARPLSEPPVALKEKLDWKDDCVTLDGGVAEVRDNPGNARLAQKLQVAKFRPYHIAVRIETEGYTGQPEIAVLGEGGKALQFASLGVKPTQGWTEHHVVFNPLESAAVNIYLGVWGAAKGRLRWKDWRIEEAGLVNILRRPGAPFEVDGLVEGEDYEPVSDAEMGARPWKGEYQPWHEPPVLRLKKGLPDGARLLVSWYHPAVIYGGQVSCCLSEPRVLDLLRDQARRMKDAWGAEGYMMSHDEIRTLNQDASCRARNLDAGAILADNVRQCRRLLEGSTAHVWSDMFDPHHNAHGDYYLVRGSVAGSWEGLSKDVVIVNWNFGKRDESLRFFAERGHRQVIAAYYDGPLDDVKAWLASASKVRGVVGIMYTTWRAGYDDIEAFAAACRPGP